ncbi:hypothetical protein FACS1894186_7380 [Alphaproteobacteria bacterium]|nr:hypothetical protein FACS1894186_7380 [Alphaproteobacteria bacterium]
MLENPSDILIEMKAVGGSVRVAAISADAGREVVFIVPRGTPEEAVRRLAAQKLAYAARKAEEAGAGAAN